MNRAEQLLKMFIKFASKAKVVREAHRLGLTGKNGRKLTLHILDTVLKNVSLRYKGLWPISQGPIPEYVPLPHGQLLPTDLLEAAEETIQRVKSKKSFSKGYTYLLSGRLYHEQAGKLAGGKGNNCRYYESRSCRKDTGVKYRVRAEAVEVLLVKTIRELIIP